MLQTKMTLSNKATCNTHGQDSSYFLGWQEYEKNPYHEITNPNGIIQMGLAENQLSFDLLESWLAKNSESSSFKRNGKSIFRELALFQDYHGLPAFKNALGQFMAEIRGNKVRFETEKLVLTAGSTAANETLMFCLAEPGEAFLLPTPYYPGFDRDLKWRTGVQIVPINCISSNGFRITSSSLESSYDLARRANLNVKGILVTNPSNPLGTTLTRHELNLLVDFADEKGIHLISDEIYSGTVFNTSPPRFTSVMEIVLARQEHTSTAAGLLNRVHVVYSLSKDLGLPGFRVGAIYSNNDQVVAAATKMSSFGLISSQTQYLLASMLSDRAFAGSYVSENRARLETRHGLLVDGLKGIGIPCLESNAGLFCWVDMRHLLITQSFDAEINLWKEIVYEVGLNISPGSSCHCVEPGWFRVCYANMSEETLRVAIKRLAIYVDSDKNGGGVPRISGKDSRRKSFVNWASRLSVTDRQRDR